MALARAGLIPELPWSEILRIIASEEIHLLGRSKDQQVSYDKFRYKLREEWKSTRDYILVSKFGYEEILTDIGKKAAREPDNIPKASVNKAERTILVENDFPYNFAKGIKHFIYWKLGGDITKEEIIEVAAKFAQENSATDYCYYFNPPHLKSIPDLEHGHILLKLSEHDESLD